MSEQVAESELTTERTPSELIKWVESKFDSMGSTDAGTKALRLRQGLAKQLAEEVYPLAIFAVKKYGETNLIQIRPVIGNQSYDAILTDLSTSPASTSYIEVTQAHEGEAEYLRALVLDENGYVPLTGPIRKEGTKRKGLQVLARLEVVSVDDAAESELQRIVSAISRKQGKIYPANTCLIVKFDDDYMFRRAVDDNTIDQFVRRNIAGLVLNFTEIYLVGKHKNMFRHYGLDQL